MKIYVYDNQCVVLDHVTFIKQDGIYITFYITGTDDSNHVVFKYVTPSDALLEYRTIINLF